MKLSLQLGVGDQPLFPPPPPQPTQCEDNNDEDLCDDPLPLNKQ